MTFFFVEAQLNRIVLNQHLSEGLNCFRLRMFYATIGFVTFFSETRG